MVWCQKNGESQRSLQEYGGNHPQRCRNRALISPLGVSLLTALVCSVGWSGASVAQDVNPGDFNLDPSDIRQGNPNQDRIPQPLPEEPSNFQDLPGLDADETAPTRETLPESGSGASILIRDIQVEGSTVYESDRLEALVEDFEGRDLTLEDLQAAADNITQLYLNDGYITTRAVLVDQEIVDGVVRIQVIEGVLGEIRIEGTERLKEKYIRNRIRLGAKVPLRVNELEDQLRLLRVDPLLESLEASLRASEKVGESILLVRATEAQAWGFSLGSDTYSPESVGNRRSRFSIYHRNAGGNGETFSGSWDRTFIGGSNVLRLTYRQPVNARNGTVQFQTTIDRNTIILPPFDALDIDGETESYEVSYRQPIIRTPRRELGLSVAYRFQDGQTFAGGVGTQLGATTGADLDGVTKVGIVKFGQDYVHRDAGGAWALQSQFSFGTDFPFNATTNDGDIPDTHFFSWLGQIQRVQRVNDRNLLIVQTDFQLATSPLLSSQQFVLGGGQSIRGYSQNLRSGDNGFRFSAENRITVARNDLGRNVLQIAPFFDTGVVWSDENNPNAIPEGRFLAGAGVGVLWQPLSNLDLRFDWGIPLVDVADPVDDPLQENGVYFNVNYRYP